jgi:capsular polysaccharide transport system permease protein
MTIAEQWESTLETLKLHRRIIWALSLREVATRYGRENLGFLWVMGEPLLFCMGVSVMWSVIKPTYEHGIRIVPFVVTGYMPLLLMRHILQHGMYAVRVNAPLLYHRQITALHLFFSRSLVETVGVSLAFILVVGLLIPLGLMELPKGEIQLIYVGWFLLSLMGFGMAMIFGGLFELFEPIERFVAIITYLMVPLSGAFYMVFWLPAQYRGYVMLIPFVDCAEMIRSGFFGDAVQVYYNIPYTAAWAAGFVVVGLIMITFVRSRVHVE